MTKTLLRMAVIVACIAGSWISLSTKLDTNSAASAEVSSKLKDQVEDYRYEATKAQTTILTHVDTTQSFVITAIAQNSSLAEQNKKLLDSLDGLTKQVLMLTQQNTDIAKQNSDLLAQIKGVNDNQTKILTEHTQTLKKASIAAANAQIDTRKTLKAVTQPKPKPWYSGIFAHPYPTPKK